MHVAAGQRTRLLLTDTVNNRTLVLQNISSGSREEIYKDGGGNAAVKVVDDQQLQELLDVLTAQGMFERTAATPQPGARALLAVEQGERRMVWSRPPASPANIDAIRVFDESRAYVLSVYNAATAYHSRKLDDPEMARVRKAIDEAKAKDDARKQKAAANPFEGHKQ